MRFLLSTVLFSFIFTLAGETAPQVVSYKKNAKGVDYTIKLEKTFEMNHQAPFKFKLRDAKETVIKKILLNKFKKKNERHYTFHTNGAETSVKWWFVACKHDKSGKITMCKTISGTKKLTTETK